MPKPFAEWVQYWGQKWQMSDVAHRLSYNDLWHRGEVDDWAVCGQAWLGVGHIRQTVGKGRAWRNPWHSRGLAAKLCPGCFAEELPLIEAIRNAIGKGCT